MSEKIWTCALTGHRDLPENFDKNALYDKLEEILKKGCDCFLCGMAQGFDMEALECLIALKRKYRFTIEACIPYVGQENHYPFAEKERYHALLAWCDRQTPMSEKYFDGCFLARDRYMVDCADVIVAYCRRDTGGTAYTVNYAMKKGKIVVFL